MYDYEATCPEEITFCEGQIIHILKRAVHDVDDGWWEGEVDGQVGLFPSLVVEECRSDGEPLTPDVSVCGCECSLFSFPSLPKLSFPSHTFLSFFYPLFPFSFPFHSLNFSSTFPYVS